MRAIPFCILMLLIMACNNTPSASNQDEYKQTVESLEKTEQKNPSRFLKATVNDKKNLIGQTVLRGRITSSAKVVSYKDVEIQLKFYSKTGALLEQDSETVYETIDPGQTIKFKSKYYAPKNTDSVSIQIIGAKL